MCELTDKLRSYHPTSGYSTTMRKAADEIDGLRNTVKILTRVVEFYGANHTERGNPHPQQALLDEAYKQLDT